MEDAAAERVVVPATEEKKGGSKMPLILIGAGGAGADGIFLAKSSEEPQDQQMMTEVFSGVLDQHLDCSFGRQGPGGPGRWEAEATWTEPVTVWMGVYTSDWADLVIEGRQQTSNTSVAEWDGGPGVSFLIELCWDNEGAGPPPGQFEVRVTYPRP